jgi:hypothetical protein
VTSISDFELPDGKIDWKAYYTAQAENGDICYKCRHYILFGGKGYPTQCNDCQLLNTSKEEVRHSSLIRCPHCGDTSAIDDRYDLYEEGEHETWCNSCDKKYTVSTRVSFTFTSEPRIPDEYSRETEED